MAEEMQIRKLTAEHDLEQYNDLLRYAFQVTEKQLLVTAGKMRTSGSRKCRCWKKRG